MEARVHPGKLQRQKVLRSFELELQLSEVRRQTYIDSFGGLQKIRKVPEVYFSNDHLEHFQRKLEDVHSVNMGWNTGWLSKCVTC